MPRLGKGSRIKPANVRDLRGVTDRSLAMIRITAHPDCDVVLPRFPEDVVGDSDEFKVRDSEASFLFGFSGSASSRRLAKIEVSPWRRPPPSAATDKEHFAPAHDNATHSDTRRFSGLFHRIAWPEEG
jgi:hypothetical protein